MSARIDLIRDIVLVNVDILGLLVVGLLLEWVYVGSVYGAVYGAVLANKSGLVLVTYMYWYSLSQTIDFYSEYT